MPQSHDKTKAGNAVQRAFAELCRENGQTLREMMKSASHRALAGWVLKNLDWSGGNSDENAEFLAVILEQAWEQAQSGARSASEAEPFAATFDCLYDGDINRCDKNCKQLGECKRRTSGVPSAVMEVPPVYWADEDEAKMLQSILSVVAHDMRDAARKDIKTLMVRNYTKGLTDGKPSSATTVATAEALIDELSAYAAKDRCEACYGAGCIGVPGAACPSCDGAGKNRLALAFKWIALEKDAGRYRHIREHTRMIGNGLRACHFQVDLAGKPGPSGMVDYYFKASDPACLDAAVDGALAMSDAAVGVQSPAGAKDG